MFTDRGTVYQVRMKDQGKTFRLVGFPVAIHAGHLPGRKKNQRAFLVIIGIPSIYQITTFHVF